MVEIPWGNFSKHILVGLNVGAGDTARPGQLGPCSGLAYHSGTSKHTQAIR